MLSANPADRPAAAIALPAPLFAGEAPNPVLRQQIETVIQEYLKAHGDPPGQVYQAFRDYVRDYPLVAHNLTYDWNRCLVPEWERLRIPAIGQRGFCTLLPGGSSARLRAIAGFPGALPLPSRIAARNPLHRRKGRDLAAANAGFASL